jgi:hypothetical protein
VSERSLLRFYAPKRLNQKPIVPKNKLTGCLKNRNSKKAEIVPDSCGRRGADDHPVDHVDYPEARIRHDGVGTRAERRDEGSELNQRANQDVRVRQPLVVFRSDLLTKMRKKNSISLYIGDTSDD